MSSSNNQIDNWEGYTFWQNKLFAHTFSRFLGIKLVLFENIFAYEFSYPYSNIGKKIYLRFPQIGSKTLLSNFYNYSKEQKISNSIINILSDSNELELLGYNKDVNGTVVIDLTKTTDLLLNEMHKENRRQIRQSSDDLSFEQITDISTFNDWLEHYELFINSKNLHKNIRERTRLFKFFRHMFQNHPSFFKIFMCRYKNSIASSAILFIDKNPLFRHGSSNIDLLKYNPNHRMHWEIIKWAKSEGYENYDLGGISFSDNPTYQGISRFKKRFGGDVYKYNIFTRKNKGYKEKILNSLISVKKRYT